MREVCARGAVADAWWRALPVGERAALFAVLFGDVVPLRPEQALAGSWLLEEAARREVARPGAKRTPIAAVAAAELGAAERALLDRVTLGPVALAGEAAPVAAIAAAHALNVAVLAAGGWGVVALVAGHLVYRPRACGAAPPSSTRAALQELAARDAVLGRWWVSSPASLVGSKAFLVEVEAGDAGDLGARVEIASAEAAARGARRVAVVVGELALVDVCPQPDHRIARWTARWRAEDLGGRVGRSGRSALDEAPDPPASAWAWRATLESVPRSGPPATAAIVGPPAFDQRWQARDGLVLRADGSVAERQTMGRPRAVSLEAVCAALLAAQAEGLDATEPEIRRRLRAQGHTVSRGFARRWGVEIGACRLFEMEPGERAESPRLTEGSRVELREAFGDAGRPPFPPGRWTASTTLRADINWDWALAAGGSVGGWAIVERIMRASDWLLLLAATPSPWVCDRARVTLLYSCARAMALSARLLGHPGEVERGLIRAEPALSWGWLTAEGRVVVDWCDGPGGPLASRLTAGQARAIAAAAGTDPETAIQPLRRRIGPDGEQMLVDGAGAVVASVRLVEGRAVMRGAR